MAMMWPDRSATQTTGDDSGSLRTLAEQCRCLARGASTARVAASLREMAENYDALALRAEETERPRVEQVQMEQAGADASC